MKVLYALLLILGLALNPLQAATLKNVQVNGLAEYIPYADSVYLAALLTDQAATTPEQVFALSGSRYMVLTVTAKEWTERRFSSHWRNAIVINNEPGEVESFDLAFRRFAVMLRTDALRQGDQIVIGIKDSKSPVVVTLNGKEQLQVERQEFFNFMLRTWIGKRPPSSSFKEGLLAGTAEPVLRDRFNELSVKDSQVRLGP